MRLLRCAAEDVRLFAVLLGLVVASFVALGVGLGLTLSATGVLASHDDPATIHACVSRSTGAARIVTDPEQCTRYERLVEWQSGETDTSGLETRIAALEDRLAEFAGIQSESGANADIADIVFSGCNVFVQNGLGNTETTNEVGNLIIGYNEDENFNEPEVRTGSHNLVIGPEHTYSSYGGLVAGFDNTISGSYASVSGGGGNIANGRYSSVSGGQANTARGDFSSVSSGQQNTASGPYSSVSGGQENTASMHASTVAGGQLITASGSYDTVIGDEDGTLDFDSQKERIIFDDEHDLSK